MVRLTKTKQEQEQELKQLAEKLSKQNEEDQKALSKALVGFVGDEGGEGEGEEDDDIAPAPQPPRAPNHASLELLRTRGLVTTALNSGTFGVRAKISQYATDFEDGRLSKTQTTLLFLMLLPYTFGLTERNISIDVRNFVEHFLNEDYLDYLRENVATEYVLVGVSLFFMLLMAKDFSKSPLGMRSLTDFISNIKFFSGVMLVPAPEPKYADWARKKLLRKEPYPGVPLPVGDAFSNMGQGLAIYSPILLAWGVFCGFSEKDKIAIPKDFEQFKKMFNGDRVLNKDTYDKLTGIKYPLFLFLKSYEMSGVSDRGIRELMRTFGLGDIDEIDDPFLNYLIIFLFLASFVLIAATLKFSPAAYQILTTVLNAGSCFSLTTAGFNGIMFLFQHYGHGDDSTFIPILATLGTLSATASICLSQVDLNKEIEEFNRNFSRAGTFFRAKKDCTIEAVEKFFAALIKFINQIKDQITQFMNRCEVPSQCEKASQLIKKCQELLCCCQKEKARILSDPLLKAEGGEEMEIVHSGGPPAASAANTSPI